MTGMAHCEAIGHEIALLDTALGLDLDQVSEARRRDIAERGGEFASHTALSTVKGAAESIIPVRGLVREVTGAEKHQKAIDNAITAGRVRRGFLKGLGIKVNCAPPAAPAGFVPVIELTKTQPPSKRKKR